MNEREDDATTRTSVLFGSLVATALALLAPVVLAPTPEANGGLAAVALAIIALAVVALAHVGSSLAGHTARALATSPSRGRDAPPVPLGRVTDPVHHPIRPRAPGLA